MEVNRNSGDSEGLDCVRVAINFKNGLHLKKLDLSQSMENVVKKLCQEEQMAYECGRLALWADKFLIDDTKCVLDANKHLVEPGSFLVLKDSPTTLVASMMQNVESTDVRNFLTDAEIESRDSVVLATMCHFDAHCIVLKILDENWEPSGWLISGLILVNRLLQRRLIRKIPTKILSKIVDAIAHGYDPPPIKASEFENYIVQCLKILSCVRRHGRLHYTSELFDYIAALLLDRSRPAVQEAALELLNFIVLFPKNAEEEREATKRIVNQRIIGCICGFTLGSELSKGMQQQLYRYQTLVLRPYWHKKVTKVLTDDPAINDLRKLAHRVERGKSIQQRRRLFSEGDERDASLLPSSPTPKEKFALFKNLRSSFKRNKETSPSTMKMPSAPSSPATLRPRVTEGSKPKTPRARRLFNSCILSNEPPADSSTDIQFDFYGPIEYAMPMRRVSEPGLLQKAVSTSFLAEPAPIAFPYKEEERALRDPALSSKAVSELTVDNLRYLAAHNEEYYTKWALNMSQSYKFADQITHIVCRVLEVGRPRAIDSPGDGFHPLVLLTYPYIMQELFCEAFALHEKTCKEMKSNGKDDEPKVLATVQEILVCALSSITKNNQLGARPTSLAELREKLSWINYEFIAEKRRRERSEVLTYDLRTKPIFLEFRTKKEQAIVELIERQRKNFMKEGQHLPKFNMRGELQKNVQDYLVLNKKGDQLIVSECPVTSNKRDDQPKVNKCPTPSRHCQQLVRIAIADIIDVSIGKQSKFYWNVFNHNENRVIKLHPENELWTCFFSLKTADNVYHNFCAPDAQSLAYWSDAFNVLLGKPMASDEMRDELQQMLDLEVRLHFLDVEGLPIPDEAPAVPPLPPNFNFLAREKKNK